MPKIMRIEAQGSAAKVNSDFFSFEVADAD